MKQLNLFEAQRVPKRKLTRKRIEHEGRKDAPWIVVNPRTALNERLFGGPSFVGAVNYERAVGDRFLPYPTPRGKKKRKKRWLRDGFTDEQIARITTRWMRSK